VDTLKIAGAAVTCLLLLSFGAACLLFPRKMQSDPSSSWWFIWFISAMPARINPIYVRIWGTLMLLISFVDGYILISAYAKAGHP